VCRQRPGGEWNRGCSTWDLLWTLVRDKNMSSMIRKGSMKGKEGGGCCCPTGRARDGTGEGRNRGIRMEKQGAVQVQNIRTGGVERLGSSHSGDGPDDIVGKGGNHLQTMKVWVCGCRNRIGSRGTPPHLKFCAMVWGSGRVER